MVAHPFSEILIKWYQVNKRDLPWRDIADPYRIWLSEIILQQTRVAQGMSYYLKFVERFPTVLDLANAHEDEVLKYWQGLGYYSRARNLHATAKIIVEKYTGKFPACFPDLLQLKGVGEYTAAAISSFAFNLPHPVVDGNVFRVISRLFAIDTPIDSTEGKKLFTEMAQQLLNETEPAMHNQAIMEFGALQCIPQQPDCSVCPLKDSCLAYAQAKVAAFPVKALKTKVRSRYFNYFYISVNNQFLMQKRLPGDIWQGLYELPLLESDILLETDEILQHELFSGIENVEISHSYHDFKHILSHQRIFARFFSIRVSQVNDLLAKYITVDINNSDKYAVSRLTSLFFEKVAI